MSRGARFSGRWLPYALLAPQLAVLLLFFFWPAAQALVEAVHLSDAFGGSRRFVGLENFRQVLANPGYRASVLATAAFTAATTALALGMGLLFAVLVDRVARGLTAYRTFVIWPYAVAPAVAGVLWWFLFNPTVGVVARGLGPGWDPTLHRWDAMLLVVLAAAWKQVSYNFVFFLAGLQAVPRSLVEAAALDGAGPVRRLASIVLPLLSPTGFFLVVMNLVYAFFETFGVVHVTTAGGPAGTTTILVYRLYRDGFVGLDLGASAAQSVVLMGVVIVLTWLQFRYVERRVSYAL
jgi:sn-glycerol 3-phosphate transport system permease protein